MCIAAVWLFNKCIYVYIVGFMKRLYGVRVNSISTRYLYFVRSAYNNCSTVTSQDRPVRHVFDLRVCERDRDVLHDYFMCCFGLRRYKRMDVRMAGWIYHSHYY